MRRSARWEGLSFWMACLLGVGAAVAAGQDTSYWCISKDLLDHAGLTLAWQDTLPLKAGERVEAMTVLDNRLYVRSSHNYGWSLNRDDGKTVYATSLAPQSYPILGWSLYNDSVICVIDNRLVDVDISKGLKRRIGDLRVSAVAPPVRNSRFVYVGAADRRLHALRADDLVEIWQAAAENDSLITTIVADEDMVVVGTDAGNLLALAADRPRKLWEFQAVEGISGPVIRDGNSFFFASKDTNVYRIDMIEPTHVIMAWRQRMEAVLDRAPRVTKDTVYQYAMGRGVTAVDRRTGRILWSLPEGTDLVAQAGTKAYVTTKTKTLTIMDNATGRKLSAMNCASVINHAANTADAKIYIADDQGHVACLTPVP